MANEAILSLVDSYADKYGIPRPLYRALINAESGYNPRAVSPAGAQGLGQLMPGTARGLGVKNPFDPNQNLRGSAQYLASQKEKFGSWNLALAAYNAGPGNVSKYGGIPPFAETQAYVKKILSQAGSINDAPLPNGVLSPSKGGLPAGQGIGLGDGSTGLGSPASGPAVDLAALQSASQRRTAVQSALGGIAKYTGAKELQLPDVNPSDFVTTATIQAAESGIPQERQQGKQERNAPQISNSILGKKFKFGGGPSDHAARPLGNWQSDNAYDLLVPIGTPVYAVADGVIDSRFGSLGNSGKTAGLRLTVNGNDNRFFYTHLSRYAPGIKPGRQVRAGELIGFSGSAVGVPHLHFGVEHGDPRSYIR